MTHLPVEPLRSALKSLEAQQSHQASRQPVLAHIFTPRDHEGALDPRRPIVIGDRGAGKSFWSGVLFHEASRIFVHASFPRLGLDRVKGLLAFSEAETLQHPTKSNLKQALEAGFSAEQIWRAVALDLLEQPGTGPQGNLLQLCAAIKSDPRAGAMRFAAISATLAKQRYRAVLIFDALDRLGDDWTAIRTLTQGVFQLALALRSIDGLHVKVFLRPDVAADDGIWAITDTSKLRHDQVKLNWRGTDLYGLLWTLLANDALAGEGFRKGVARLLPVRFEKKQVQNEIRWSVPVELAENAEAQRHVFDVVAGEFMGRSKKRGRTYSWVINHLQDASGHATPRSFVLAMRTAGEEAKAKDTVLDVQGIQEGVRKASEVRVDELKEDYRWISRVFEPLKGTSVPVEAEELVETWRDAGTLPLIHREAAADTSGRYLLPIEMMSASQNGDPRILIEALTRLSIMSVRSDGRRDFPDLFRVAADMKRKGGIPVKR